MGCGSAEEVVVVILVVGQTGGEKNKSVEVEVGYDL
jgi:hypothetical protein